MTTINNTDDLLRALSENPEWRAAVRAQILGDELIQLPARFDAFVAQVTSFVARQEQFNERMATSVEGLNNRMGAFIDAQTDLNERIIRRLDRITDDTAQIKGAHARATAVDDAPGIAVDMGMEYVRTVARAEVVRMAQKASGGDIPANELRSFRYADLIIEVTDGNQTNYIAVEASFTADQRDTDRALRNARFLTRFTGCPAQAAIASVRNDRDLDEKFAPGNVYWHPIPGRDLEPE